MLIVAAAGNGSSSRPSYPAAYAGVLAVSAVGLDGSIAPYSSFGSFVDIAAPVVLDHLLPKVKEAEREQGK